jgi:fatty-acyl-CoA synthase
MLGIPFLYSCGEGSGQKCWAIAEESDVDFVKSLAMLEQSPTPDMVTVLANRAKATPDRPAVACGDKQVSYRELWDNSLAAARLMIDCGVQRGDRVGILLPTCIPFVFATFGAQFVGAVPLPIHVRYRFEELRHVINDSSVKVIVTDNEHEALPLGDRIGEVAGGRRKVAYGAATVVAEELPSNPTPLRTLISVQSGADVWRNGPVAKLSEQEFSDELLRRSTFRSTRDTAFILYTSGTTGAAKGVPLSHEAFVSNSIQLGRTRFLLGEGKTFWNPLPLYHIAGIGTLVASIEAGAKWVGVEHYNPEKAVDELERHRPTAIYPTWQAITDSLFDEIRRRNIELPYVEVVLNAGHPRLLRRWQEELSVFAPQAVQITGWGLTETSGLSVLTHPTDGLDHRVDTVGFPFVGVEVCVVDPETRAVLAPGQAGELAIRGRSLFAGYWQDAEKTAGSHLDDGWFLSGDQGSMTADGRVCFNSRLRDVLKVGGENVSAAEVEAVLVAHPSVAEAQVIGVPDPRLGEVAAAYIKPVVKNGWNEQDLIAYCTQKLARFKVPKYIREIDEWPMSATKVRKVDLRTMLLRELGLQQTS